MSVLQGDEYGACELLRCKLDYLQSENTWMQAEYGFLCRLIELQKQAIHSHSSSAINQTISQVMKERQKYLESIKRKTEEVSTELEAEEFVPFIYSFEEKIERLQKEMKNREASLQQIELSKLEESDQRRPQFKCISSYESQSRILDRVKKEIASLQLKKQHLENQLLALNQKNQEESTVSSQVQSRSKVAFQQPTNQDDQYSVFQRLVILIKKKCFQNNCLQDKVTKLKSSIQRKREATNQLRKEIEGLQWNCLDGMGACGFVDADKGDLSLAGRSFTYNNTSFSFDVSRFIRPKGPLRGIE